mgnify:CR=1 FL=1
MFPWKVLLGIVAGAVFVKEWKRADRLYGSARAKLMGVVRKLNQSWQDDRNDNGPEPKTPTVA